MRTLIPVLCMLFGLVDPHHSYNIHISAVFVSQGWNVPAVISWSRVHPRADGMPFRAQVVFLDTYYTHVCGIEHPYSQYSSSYAVYALWLT